MPKPEGYAFTVDEITSQVIGPLQKCKKDLLTAIQSVLNVNRVLRVNSKSSQRIWLHP